jgi:hypothetical protein
LTRDHRLLPLRRLSLLLLLLLLPPGAARAQDLYTYSIGLLGGVGGSVDASPGNDLGNTGFQVDLALLTEPRTLLGVRAGRLSLDRQDQFGSLHDASLSYATVGGEYRFQQSFYDSGIYMALGGYRLNGKGGDGRDRSDTSVGLAVGVTGEFKVNRWLGVLVELSGHYAHLDDAQFFAMGHAGLAVHF